MSGMKPKRLAPLSIRLSEEERAELKRHAGDQALSAYVKHCVFNKRAASKPGTLDQTLVALLLARLASSGLAGSLETLSSAAHTGTLPVTDETEKALRLACDQIADMRLILLKGMGFRDSGLRS